MRKVIHLFFSAAFRSIAVKTNKGPRLPRLRPLFIIIIQCFRLPLCVLRVLRRCSTSAVQVIFFFPIIFGNYFTHMIFGMRDPGSEMIDLFKFLPEFFKNLLVTHKITASFPFKAKTKYVFLILRLSYHRIKLKSIEISTLFCSVFSFFPNFL